MSLYLWLDLLAISIPFLVSFHPRIQLHKQWAYLFPALLISLVPYIIWDIYFTINGYWGFNEAYLTGVSLWYLPIEEWLFFICIPYACIFTHIALLEINPKLKLSLPLTKIITGVLSLLFLLVFLLNYDKAYTAVDMAFGFVILAAVYLNNKELLRAYYITFLFMLIPFFIVNGVLTGTGITDQVVWYNDEQNLGIRMGTIPVEDSVYAFSLILMGLGLFEYFSKKADRKAS